MNIEEIRQLKITFPNFEIRAGKDLTVIELMKDGKSCGRELTFRNQTEIDELITGLAKVKEFLATI